jgi:hypothetical protein
LGNQPDKKIHDLRTSAEYRFANDVVENVNGEKRNCVFVGSSYVRRPRPRNGRNSRE